MTYISEILLEKTAEMSGVLIGGAFVFALLFSPLIPKLANKLNKKKMMMLTAALFSVLLFATGLFGTFISFPVAFILIVLAGVPISVIFILPNAIVADIAELDGMEQ